MIHVEIFPSDAIINDLVMRSFSAEEQRLGSAEKWSLYKQRRVEFAARMNREAVEENGLVLLVKRNGKPTNRLKQLTRAMRPPAKTA